MKKSWINIALSISLLTLSMNTMAEAKLYRYKDKDGQLVITNTLPSEVANQGYEIITSRGNVIERIEPKETAEDLAKDKVLVEQQKLEQQKVDEKKRQAALQAKKDEILLKSFTNEADILRSRDEKIASITILEQIMRENVSRLQKQLSDAEHQARNYADQKQAIPEMLSQTIQDTKRQIEENNNFLARKHLEKQEIQTKYQGLVDRFKQLNQPVEQ